jgi:penicillin-binding protein 1A
MSLLLRLRQALAGLLLALHSRLAPWLSRLRRPSRRELLLGLAALPALLLVYSLILIPFTPGIRDIRKAKLEQPARVLSADGKELAVFKWANREWVGLERISPQVKAALIATEDHRFYEHHGIDFYRLAGAALRTFTGDKQGGSTLTQQLARNLFPDEIGRAPTLTRKLKEAITAFKIEACTPRTRSSRPTSTPCPFSTTPGASRWRRAPTSTSRRAAGRAGERHAGGHAQGQQLLQPGAQPRAGGGPAQHGAGADGQARQARRGPPGRPAEEARCASTSSASSKPPARRPTLPSRCASSSSPGPTANGYNIYADGLVVRTTIDSACRPRPTRPWQRQGRQLQALADQAWAGRKGWAGSPELVEAFVRESAPPIARRWPGARRPRSAGPPAGRQALPRRPAPGARPACRWVFWPSTRGTARCAPGWAAATCADRPVRPCAAQARRQPGSTFKPFVYGAAFDKGMQPGDTLIDREVEIPLPDDEVWRPTDGPAQRQAHEPARRPGVLPQHHHRAADAQVGPARVAGWRAKMGVRQSPLEEVPSLALGTSPVTLKEMVAAYGTMANGGGYIEPVLITRIEDRSGKVLEEFAPPSPSAALTRAWPTPCST